MISRTYKTEGIILGRKNFSEADRILIVFTKDCGKVSLLAKGVRYTKSKKRGSLEVFSWIKFQATRTRSLDLVTEVELVDSFSEVRSNLRKVALAYYLVEVVGRTTHEHEINTEVFFLIVDCLNKLKFAKELKTLRINFVTKLLEVLGFWPKGKLLLGLDEKLAEVTERKISSARVGKMITE